LLVYYNTHLLLSGFVDIILLVFRASPSLFLTLITYSVAAHQGKPTVLTARPYKPLHEFPAEATTTATERLA
ncbi:MAG: hypothetical protein QXD32_03755, partial [Nitrososphaerota archaeon]